MSGGRLLPIFWCASGLFSYRIPLLQGPASRHHDGLSGSPILPPRKRKVRNRKLQAASQRLPEVREYINQHIHNLIELYEKTDPAKGESSEDNKLERARQAISIWWYLFGELLLWAQSHIAGYEIARENPELIEKLSRQIGDEIHIDSHVLEYIGLMYSWNRVNYDDPMADTVERWMEKYNVGLETPNLRYLIR